MFLIFAQIQLGNVPQKAENSRESEPHADPMNLGLRAGRAINTLISGRRAEIENFCCCYVAANNCTTGTLILGTWQTFPLNNLNNTLILHLIFHIFWIYWIYYLKHLSEFSSTKYEHWRLSHEKTSTTSIGLHALLNSFCCHDTCAHLPWRRSH